MIREPLVGRLAPGEVRMIPLDPPLSPDHRLVCIPFQGDVVVTSTLTSVTITNNAREARSFTVAFVSPEVTRTVAEGASIVHDGKSAVQRAVDFLRRLTR